MSILHDYFDELLLTFVLLVLTGMLCFFPGNETVKQGFAGVLGGLLTVVTKRAIQTGPTGGSVQVINPPADSKEK